MTRELIGYPEALGLTLGHISSLDTETVGLSECQDRVAACDLRALVDSPSVDASLKDGFAICSRDIEHASTRHPVTLQLLGTAAAGIPYAGSVRSTSAVRILTGGRVPDGADAVVADEFATTDGDKVVVTNHSEAGRNIFLRGKDVTGGERLVTRGTRLSPGRIGILAAAGHSDVSVFQRPRVAMIATGDEVVMPGRPLPEGKVHASNLATLNAWCRRFGMAATMEQVSDDPALIKGRIVHAMESADALITSGGAWTGDRDLVAAMLEQLGWTRCFHRIRIGPGKAVGFGLLKGKPVFVLPGGPPSNLLAFLAIALPGLLKLEGGAGASLPIVHVRIGKEIVVRDRDWTQFIVGTVVAGDDWPLFMPLELDSRLRSIATAQAVVVVPEGIDRLKQGGVSRAWDLS
ncbi:MAG: molybdopterin molybdotransferase MoeA [Thermoanaerobaculia bacterium]